MRKETSLRVSQCLASLLLTAGLSGCALISTFPDNAAKTPLGQVVGNVHGGQQAIVGAHVYVMQAGTLGYGSAATSLITAGSAGSDAIGEYVLSGTYGSFSVTGDYTCTSGDQVYVLAIGGDPGAGTNTAAGLMAALGQCPSTGTLAATVPFVDVNEISTVAAAYALAGFATDATHIGAPNTTLSRVSLANAFATAGNLENLATGVAYTATPATGSSGVVPQSRINTLANILAACINTSGSTSSSCSTLRSNATADGTSTGTQPSETATAAINIAHHPAASTSALFNLQSSTAPFKPDLAASPSDFTIQLIFTGGGLAAANSLSYEPHSIAVDGSGNVWAAGGTHTSVLSKFSPLGAATSFASDSDYATSIAIDATSSNIWISNYGFSSASLAKYNIAGNTATQYAAQLSFNDTPVDIALDGSGNVWVADESDGNSAAGSGALLKFNSATGSLSLDTYGTNGLAAPWGVAIQAGTSGNIWVTDEAGNGYGTSGMSVYGSSGSTIGNYTSGSLFHPIADAIDSMGNVWIGNSAETTSGLLNKVSSAGSSEAQYSFGTGAFYMSSIAIDGGNNVWMAGNSASALFEITNAGSKVSPAAGFVAVNASGSSSTTVQSVAIDGSGNVWYNSGNDAALREIIGAAVPTVVPLAYAVANNLLGSKP